MSLQLSKTADSFVQIQPNEWKILLDLYKSKNTESTGYPLINNFIKWWQNSNDLQIECVTLDSEWKSHGTFMFIVLHGGPLKNLYFNTLEDNQERLIKLLCGYVTKAKDYLLYGYGERLKPAVDAYVKQFEHEQLETADTVWYTVNKEIAAAFSIEPPAGITLRQLVTEDAPGINAVWPHRAEGSVGFVQMLIENSISVGACDEDGNLVAWCLRLPLGSLGVLQVKDSHRRFGLGSLVVRYMSRKISEMGEEVLAPVVTVNTPSRKMFEKLGFEGIDNVYWTYSSD